MTAPIFRTVGEQTRTYYFSSGQFTVENVVKFADSTFTHRLETKEGKKYIIPKTFLAIELDVKEWTL